MQCRSITISSKMKSFTSINWTCITWKSGQEVIIQFTLGLIKILYLQRPCIHFKFSKLLPKLILYQAHLQIMIRTKDTIKLSHISRVCSLVAIHSLYEASSSTAAALIESLHETNGTRDVNLATPSFMGETRQNGPSY